MSDALDIASLLTELGFAPGVALEQAREALVAARLTLPHKQNIAANKRARVEATLAELFLVTCGEDTCEAQAGGRTLFIAPSRDGCHVCGGSANERTLQLARDATASAGLSRIVVVGGSPNLHEDLRKRTPVEWELRIVDGTARHTVDQARTNLEWAHVVLIWGATQLDHKVSRLYTVHRDARCVVINRRGLSSLFDAIREHALKRRG